MMEIVENYLLKKGEALKAKNSDQAIKHLIDLCLDTEDNRYYQYVLNFLDRIDAGITEDEFWDTTSEPLFDIEKCFTL